MKVTINHKDKAPLQSLIKGSFFIYDNKLFFLTNTYNQNLRYKCYDISNEKFVDIDSHTNVIPIANCDIEIIVH